MSDHRFKELMLRCNIMGGNQIHCLDRENRVKYFYEQPTVNEDVWSMDINEEKRKTVVSDIIYNEGKNALYKIINFNREGQAYVYINYKGESQ